PLTGTLLIVICLAAAFGIIQFLVAIVDWIKNPSVPRIKGGYTDDGWSGGCVGGDNFGGNSDSSCGDDSDSGCGGG
ncbi:MAG: hypothetical protein ACYT04_29855, partial [Nostoc sp.]